MMAECACGAGHRGLIKFDAYTGMSQGWGGGGAGTGSGSRSGADAGGRAAARKKKGAKRTPCLHVHAHVQGLAPRLHKSNQTLQAYHNEVQNTAASGRRVAAAWGHRMGNPQSQEAGPSFGLNVQPRPEERWLLAHTREILNPHTP